MSPAPYKTFDKVRQYTAQRYNELFEQGYTYKEIAEEFSVSDDTVGRHLNHLWSLPETEDLINNNWYTGGSMLQELDKSIDLTKSIERTTEPGNLAKDLRDAAACIGVDNDRSIANSLYLIAKLMYVEELRKRRML